MIRIRPGGYPRLLEVLGAFVQPEGDGWWVFRERDRERLREAIWRTCGVDPRGERTSPPLDLLVAPRAWGEAPVWVAGRLVLSRGVLGQDVYELRPAPRRALLVVGLPAVALEDWLRWAPAWQVAAVMFPVSSHEEVLREIESRGLVRSGARGARGGA